MTRSLEGLLEVASLEMMAESIRTVIGAEPKI